MARSYSQTRKHSFHIPLALSDSGSPRLNPITTDGQHNPAQYFSPAAQAAGESPNPPELRAQLHTLILHIPRLHNPDADGRRARVSLKKLKLTIRELRSLFSGYSVSLTNGWSREDGVRDSHYRFEMDFQPTQDLLNQVTRWKKTLETRFEQRSLYMKISDGTVWL